MQSGAYIEPIILENHILEEIYDKMSQASIEMDHGIGQPSKLQVDPLPSSILWPKVAHGRNKNLHPNIKIDPMMLPRSLPIVVPSGLQ